MCKVAQSVLMLLAVFLAAPSWAATYTASELSIEKIFPDISCKTFSKPSGGFVSNSQILEMAVENTVYPPSGGGALKKVIPVALTYGRWMPWAAAAFTAGYMIGDYFFTKWHEDEHDIYWDGDSFYQEVEKLVYPGCDGFDALIAAAKPTMEEVYANLYDTL